MPNIKQYTRQVEPQQLNNVRADASSFGGDTTGLQMQARALQQTADAAQGASDAVNAVHQRILTREDTVNRVREADKFYQESFDEFNRAQTEQDLTDPAVVKKFNQDLRDKASKYISGHTGSPDSRAKLEAQITDMTSQFTRQMTSNGLQAQRKFIMAKAADQINLLAKQAADNPGDIGNIFKQADAVVQDLSPALYPEDEIDMVHAAQEQISLSALQSYTDSGRYEDAKKLIDDNPFFMQALNPNAQRSILSTIQTGIQSRNEEVTKVKNKMSAIKTAAQELGVDVSGPALFSAVTGIEDAQTPEAKLNQFAAAVGKKPEELTPSVIAKVGFGVDLPEADQINYNKEYTPNGDMTPLGIQGRIKTPFEKAAAAKTFMNKVNGAIGQFRNDGNKQALLTAMITFQKALDEGAVVREGDIVLQREAQSLSDSISLWAKPGQIVGNELVDEMEATMNNFTMQALKSAKTQIDPILAEGDRLGYKRVNTLPKESYDAVFGGIPDDPKTQAKPDKTTITADEFLQQ